MHSFLIILVFLTTMVAPAIVIPIMPQRSGSEKSDI